MKREGEVLISRWSISVIGTASPYVLVVSPLGPTSRYADKSRQERPEEMLYSAARKSIFLRCDLPSTFRSTLKFTFVVAENTEVVSVLLLSQAGNKFSTSATYRTNRLSVPRG